MTALPVSAGESAVREAVERLSAIEPGPYEVVSCYLKLEPRDKARAKYLIKIKNRIKQLASDLERAVFRGDGLRCRRAAQPDCARHALRQVPRRAAGRAQSSHAHSGGKAPALRPGGR